MNVKRSFSTMRRVFAEGFAARDLAGSLVVFDADLDASYVRGKMQDNGITVAGVREQRTVTGYILADELGKGPILHFRRVFTEADLLPDSASFTKVLQALVGNDFVFLVIFGDVGGIIVRNDLEKPPMRMWLFGMITIVEMELSRLIQTWNPNGQWRQNLTAQRLAKAEHIMREHERLGKPVNPVDCLQLGDKARILVKNPEILRRLGFETPGSAKETFKQLEHLRNNLAHAQEIVTYDWEIITGLTDCLDAIFRREG